MEILEKNVEFLTKVMEERGANANMNMEFMWKKMEEQDESMNQQMEDMRVMLTSFLTRQNKDREEAQFEQFRARR